MEDERLVKVLKALADHNRLQMVRELAQAGELSCGQLGALFDLSQPTVSHHLKILVDSGVVRVRKDGQHHQMSVERTLLEQIGRLLPEQTAVRKQTGIPRRQTSTRRKTK